MLDDKSLEILKFIKKNNNKIKKQVLEEKYLNTNIDYLLKNKLIILVKDGNILDKDVNLYILTNEGQKQIKSEQIDKKNNIFNKIMTITTAIIGIFGIIVPIILFLIDKLCF